MDVIRSNNVLASTEKESSKKDSADLTAQALYVLHICHGQVTYFYNSECLSDKMHR